MMDDTEKPDPLLKQVPLIRNPAYQPPRPITLNTNYGKLLATLPGSVMPPKVGVSEQDLREWTDELVNLRGSCDKDKKEVAMYEQWLAGVQRKVAPGFNFEVMTPTNEKFESK